MSEEKKEAKDKCPFPGSCAACNPSTWAPKVLHFKVDLPVAQQEKCSHCDHEHQPPTLTQE